MNFQYIERVTSRSCQGDNKYQLVVAKGCVLSNNKIDSTVLSIKF